MTLLHKECLPTELALPASIAAIATGLPLEVTFGSGVPSGAPVTGIKLYVDTVSQQLYYWSGAAWGLLSASIPTAFSWRTVTASTTVAAGDIANGIAVNSALASVVTVPTNASVPIAIGSSIIVATDSVGVVTIAPAVGVVVAIAPGLGLGLAGQYSVVTIIKRSTDVWYAAGDFAVSL